MFERVLSPYAGMLSAGEPGAAGGGNGEPETPEEPTVSMTQAEFDALIAREKSKAGKSAVNAFKTEEAQKQSQAQQTAEQKAEAEKAAAEQRASEAEAKANARIVRADAKGVAANLGFRADRVNEVLQFADLSDVTVDDNGDADQKAIEAALKPLLKRFPEWAGGGKDIGGGFNSGGSDGSSTNSVIPEANRRMNDMFRRSAGRKG